MLDRFGVASFSILHPVYQRIVAVSIGFRKNNAKDDVVITTEFKANRGGVVDKKLYSIVNEYIFKL